MHIIAADPRAIPATVPVANEVEAWFALSIEPSTNATVWAVPLLKVTMTGDREVRLEVVEVVVDVILTLCVAEDPVVVVDEVVAVERRADGVTGLYIVKALSWKNRFSSSPLTLCHRG